MILRDPGRKQTMEGSLEGVGALGGLVLLVLVVLTILLPVSVYSAQKYAYKCYIQLEYRRLTGFCLRLPARSRMLSTV